MRLMLTLNPSMEVAEAAEAGVEDDRQDEVAEAMDVDVDAETKNNVKFGQDQETTMPTTKRQSTLKLREMMPSIYWII